MFKKIKKAKNILIFTFCIEILFTIGLILFIFFYGINKKYDPYIIIAWLSLIFVYNFSLFFSFSKQEEKFLVRSDITIANILGNETSSIFEFGNIAMLVYNDDDEVIWTNQTSMIKTSSVIGKNIYSLIPELDSLLDDNTKNNIYTNIEGKKFLVNINKGLKVIYIKDVTIEDMQKTLIEETSPFIGHVIIDNYQDVFTSFKEAEFLIYVTKIKDLIMKWANDNNLFIRSYSNDAFLILGEEKNFIKIKKEQFNILDEIRKTNHEEENPLTISIGIGKGHTSIQRLSELSYAALNMALSRGGDQVVINTFGYPLEYFGAKNEIKQSRSHVRGRVLATSIANLISESKSIMIMGHKQMDFDALGASLGIYALCDSLNVKSHVIYEDSLVELQTKRAFKQVFSQNEINKMCLTPAKALSLTNEQTLIIVVDTHRPESTMQPLLLEKSKNVCVIDHHRRSDVFINDPIFLYHEPQSSSTSELVTELVFYQKEKVELSSEIANFLLAGICLDTKFYHSSTSSKTFEMSMILKNYNASVDVVNEFFKEEYEEKRLLNSILNNCYSPFTGIIFAYVDDENPIDRTVLAKAAEELLNTKNINAAFVIGKTGEKQIGISARSSTSFNVQIIMESMGGGGHFTAAATQINTNETIDEIMKKLKENINIYIRDGRI